MITDEMYSPVLHRVNQAIRTRAIKPDELVKPPAEILVKFRSPPDTLVEKSRGKLEKLIKAAKVQKGVLAHSRPLQLADHVPQCLLKPKAGRQHNRSNLSRGLMLMLFWDRQRQREGHHFPETMLFPNSGNGWIKREVQKITLKMLDSSEKF